MTPDSVKTNTVAPFRARPGSLAAAAAECESAILEFPLEATPALSAPRPRAPRQALPVRQPAALSRMPAKSLLLTAIAAAAIGTAATWIFFARATPGASTASSRIDPDPQVVHVPIAEPVAAVAPNPPSASAPSAAGISSRGEKLAEAADRPSPVVGTTTTPAVSGVATVSAPPQLTGPGWISVRFPFAVAVFEGGRLLGSSNSPRIQMRAGSHQLEFVSEPFGFRQAIRVNVPAGRGAAVSLSVPKVAININAVPWAEVLINGTRVGDTPLANVLQPIGDHEIVFRHPQLGEKRHVARIAMGEAQRISIDMRQP